MLRRRLHRLEQCRCRVCGRMYADTSGLCGDCQQLIDTVRLTLERDLAAVVQLARQGQPVEIPVEGGPLWEMTRRWLARVTGND